MTITLTLTRKEPNDLTDQEWLGQNQYFAKLNVAVDDGKLILSEEKQLILYDEGDHEDDWEVGAVGDPGAYNLSKEEDHLLIESNEEDAYGTWITSEKVDVTDWDKLYVEGDISSIYGRVRYGLADDKEARPNEVGDWEVSVRISGIGDFPTEEEILDISGVSGEWYVGWGSWPNKDITARGEVYKVWLLKDE